MNRSNLFAVAMIVAGLVVAAALLSPASTATAQSGMSGRYHIVTNDKVFVMYDVNDSSKTWVLDVPSTYKRLAWKPIKRLDSDSEVQNWELVEGARR